MKQLYSRRAIITSMGVLTVSALIEPFGTQVSKRKKVMIDCDFPALGTFREHSVTAVDFICESLNRAQPRFEFAAGKFGSDVVRLQSNALLTNPSSFVGAQLPFSYLIGGLAYPEQHEWVWNLGGLAFLNETRQDGDAFRFPMGSTGPIAGMWFKGELGKFHSGIQMAALADTKDFVESLGCRCIPYSYEGLLSLDSDRNIDGFVCLTPSSDGRFSFSSNFPNHYSTNWSNYAKASPTYFTIEIPEFVIEGLSQSERRAFNAAIKTASAAISRAAYVTEFTYLEGVCSGKQRRQLDFGAEARKMIMEVVFTVHEANLGNSAAIRKYRKLLPRRHEIVI